SRAPRHHSAVPYPTLFRSAADAREIVASLRLSAEIENQGGALAICDPVRGDRRARRQQFLDHDKTLERSHPATAILCRQRKAEKDRKSTRLNSSHDQISYA